MEAEKGERLGGGLSAERRKSMTGTTLRDHPGEGAEGGERHKKDNSGGAEMGSRKEKSLGWSK